MVRDKKTIFAEANDEDTVKVSEESSSILEDGFIIAVDDKTIFQKTNDFGTIIYLLDGKVHELKIQPNKKLGISTDGLLTWL